MSGFRNFPVALVILTTGNALAKNILVEELAA
jgi:hypothetical protein